MSVITAGLRARKLKASDSARRSQFCTIALCGVLLGFSLPGFAAENDTFTLSQALARVLTGSPRLAIYPYDQRAAEARELQAGLRPNPELEIELENLVGTGDESGPDQAEVTLALSQVIEMGSKRQYRSRLAQANSHILEQDYQLARLDVLAEAATGFLAVVQARQLVDLAEQMAEWTRQAEQVAQAKHQAGGGSRVELSQARIEAIQASLRLAQCQKQLETARLQLASLWGASQATFPPVAADLYQLAKIPTFADVRARLENAPQLQSFVTLERLRQAEMALAKANARQDISVGLGIRQLQATSEQALVVGFSIPLGVNDRNQGNVAAARAEQERLAVERAATRVSLLAELFRLYQQLEQAELATRTLREAAMPEAKQGLDELQEGYRSGRYTYLQLLEARRQLATVTYDAIAAATEFHQTLVALETLIGEPLAMRPSSALPSALSSALTSTSEPQAKATPFSEPRDGSTSVQDIQ